MAARNKGAGNAKGSAISKLLNAGTPPGETANSNTGGGDTGTANANTPPETPGTNTTDLPAGTAAPGTETGTNTDAARLAAEQKNVSGEATNLLTAEQNSAVELAGQQGAHAGAQFTQQVTELISNKNNSDPKAEIPALFISSRGESFRRCGFRFGKEPFGIALECLTEEQIKILKEEPNLVVEEVDALLDNLHVTEIV